MASGDSRDRILPALRFRSLTALYDPVVRAVTREGTFKRRLVEQAAIAAGHEVLDLGCGTGTLAVMIAEREPGAHVRGLDADPTILERARAKAEAAGAAVRFDEGLATELPYEEGSFDRVLTSLVLHHLTAEDKRRAAAEVRRVLRPGGELHVADWGRQGDPAMRAVFALTIQLLDGFERTGPHARGELPGLLAAGGLSDVRVRDALRTPTGRLELLSARRA